MTLSKNTVLGELYEELELEDLSILIVGLFI